MDGLRGGELVTIAVQDSEDGSAGRKKAELRYVAPTPQRLQSVITWMDAIIPNSDGRRNVRRMNGFDRRAGSEDIYVFRALSRLRRRGIMRHMR